MDRISRSELTALRLKRAANAVQILNGEIEELKKRLNLVEIHNDELQDLIDRIGESSATIAASIQGSLDTLDSDFVSNEDENQEIESAEAFSEVGSVDVDFDF